MKWRAFVGRSLRKMNTLALTGGVQTYKLLGERLLTSFPAADR